MSDIIQILQVGWGTWNEIFFGLVAFFCLVLGIMLMDLGKNDK